MTTTLFGVTYFSRLYQRVNYDWLDTSDLIAAESGNEARPPILKSRVDKNGTPRRHAVEIDKLPYAATKDDYYVTASFLAPYKRTDKAVSEARALVFAGCEDFGIALAEAQACGTPLVAFARGGASDIVRRLGDSERPTGILFERQTAGAVKEAVEHFEAHCKSISPAACRQNANRFSVDRFHREIRTAFDLAREVNAAA